MKEAALVLIETNSEQSQMEPRQFRALLPSSQNTLPSVPTLHVSSILAPKLKATKAACERCRLVRKRVRDSARLTSEHHAKIGFLSAMLIGHLVPPVPLVI